jgi:class 3 adenylate cyclase/tetratricopeptide (TPR) repeat protein
VICGRCGTENRAEAKFCRSCGSALGLTCPNGHPVDAGSAFCDECGARVVTTPTGSGLGNPPQPAASSPSPPPTAERRLVSVLFADLVGFTTLSESRDAEEVRDLLSRYFDTCSRLITRYGGTVEKFIGDAVMAVWGTPTAQEDDAERAVRAALDLTQAVAGLGTELGAPDLQARVGVLTGEAAVTLAAQGQGMVAGDLVNTASRVQSVAEPGTVLVGEVTRRATEAAIQYEDAGVHELKGKAEPVQLWRAARVIGGVRGAMKSSGLEAPFVGRERELRLVKEMFHASAEEGKAHLVSVLGIAGIGKSRLSWEFFKYIDGLADPIWWHRGRCLAYGDGVTYWALADMVRMRARIDDGEDAATASAKLHAAMERHVPDPEERRWIEPRLAQLLGLEEGAGSDREELFGAWRLFFERLSEESPTILVFEDMQWADAALLDFVEYMLEWSRAHPLFVMALARPELADRHPNWAAGKRNFTSLFLEPLPTSVMEQLLSGLVPGLPHDLQSKILERAEGVPLYAVETVRMLIDRGLVVPDGNRYRPAGPVEALDVPETLHALIAARLDGLAPEERRLLQDASVLGKSFTKQGLAAIGGLPETQVETLLSSLVRKEVLSFQTDPRSSERGQFGFLQDLVKRVAYETLSKKERKARHVAVAKYLESSWGSDDDEIVEIVASHYVEAFRAAPEAADAGELKQRAGESLERAGDRAASLAANEDAQRYYEQAMELSPNEGPERASLASRAAKAAQAAGRFEQARTHFDEAIAGFSAAGEEHRAALVKAALAELVWWDLGNLDEGLAMMESAFAVLANDEPDEAVATVAAQLGRIHYFAGHLDQAYERVDFALDIAESLWLPEVLSQALNTKNLVVGSRGRHEEALGLLTRALDIALEHDLTAAAMRAYTNMAYSNSEKDDYEAAREYDLRGLELARRVGRRNDEWIFLVHLAFDDEAVGEWDRMIDRLNEAPAPDEVPEAALFLSLLKATQVPMLARRGSTAEAERLLASLPYQESPDLQDRATWAMMRATIDQAKGDPAAALAAAQVGIDLRAGLSLRHPAVRECFARAIEAAFDLADLDRVEELLGLIAAERPSGASPSLRAHLDRFQARVATARGPGDQVEPRFKSSAAAFRELGMPFPLAVTLLEHGEWLTGQGRADDARMLLNEAAEIFQRLKAAPWLERTAKAGSGLEIPASV